MSTKFKLIGLFKEKGKKETRIKNLQEKYRISNKFLKKKFNHPTSQQATVFGSYN